MLNYNHLILLVILSAIVSTVSVTITKAKIFRGFREFVYNHNNFLGELFHCPYCTSHWVSLPVVLLSGVRPLVFGGILDIVIATFLMVVSAAPWSKLITWSYVEYED